MSSVSGVIALVCAITALYTWRLLWHRRAAEALGRATNGPVLATSEASTINSTVHATVTTIHTTSHATIQKPSATEMIQPVMHIISDAGHTCHDNGDGGVGDGDDSVGDDEGVDDDEGAGDDEGVDDDGGSDGGGVKGGAGGLPLSSPALLMSGFISEHDDSESEDFRTPTASESPPASPRPDRAGTPWRAQLAWLEGQVELGLEEEVRAGQLQLHV